MTEKPETRNLLAPVDRPETVMVRGEGSYLFDAEGHRYLDFVQGWAVNVLGHCAPEIREALEQQASALINASPAYHSEAHLLYASRLCEAAGFDRVFFCNSGAEANEGAIKLARKWGKVNRDGAHEIVTFHGSFHGRTLATMAASGKPGWDTLFGPASPGFRKVAFGDLSAVEKTISDATVAVMLEPIQGESGVVDPPEGFLQELRELTRHRDVLLICDEIQTGMARTGPLFAHRAAGITPDIMTLGKGIGGGVPLAALLAREDVACFEPGDQGGTFNGNPLMMAVGLAVLDRVTSAEFVEHAERVARRLDRHLAALCERHPGMRCTGNGHLRALVLPTESARQIVARCHEAGLLINAPRPDRLRFMPALTPSEDEVDEMISVLQAQLGA